MWVSTIFQILIGFLALDTGLAATPNNDLNLYNYHLENLSRFSTTKTQSFQGQPSIWVSVQPDCTSCKTQIKNLNCLPGDTRKVALGVRGTREELSKIMRPLSFKGDQLLSVPELTNRLSLHATPTLLIVNSKGELHKKIVGSQTCETLKAYLNEIKTNEKVEF